MTSKESLDVARRATAIYDEGLRATLEASETGKFVAIEPDSGDYFVASAFSEAIQMARKAHPDRLPFVIRVGHRTAVEIG